MFFSREDGILVKKPKKDFSLTKNNESDSSDGEQGVGNPFLELVKSLGAGPGSYGNELKGNWRDDESDKNEEEEIEEEMGQSENEDEVDETKKQVNGDAEAVGKLQENGEGNNDSEGDDDEENGVDDTESTADDYRMEAAAGEESEDEEERDESNDADEMKGKSSAGSQDPFTVHFEQDLSETTEKLLSDPRTWKQKTRKIPSFGNVTEVIPLAESLPTLDTSTENEMSFVDLKIKSRLALSWQAINKIPNSEGLFSPLQQDLFYHINAYKDVYFSSRTFQNGDEIRRLYCLHAVNHILKLVRFITLAALEQTFQTEEINETFIRNVSCLLQPALNQTVMAVSNGLNVLRSLRFHISFDNQSWNMPFFGYVYLATNYHLSAGFSNGNVSEDHELTLTSLYYVLIFLIGIAYILWSPKVLTLFCPTLKKLRRENHLGKQPEESDYHAKGESPSYQNTKKQPREHDDIGICVEEICVEKICAGSWLMSTEDNSPGPSAVEQGSKDKAAASSQQLTYFAAESEMDGFCLDVIDVGEPASPIGVLLCTDVFVLGVPRLFSQAFTNLSPPYLIESVFSFAFKKLPGLCACAFCFGVRMLCVIFKPSSSTRVPSFIHRKHITCFLKTCEVIQALSPSNYWHACDECNEIDPSDSSKDSSIPDNIQQNFQSFGFETLDRNWKDASEILVVNLFSGNWEDPAVFPVQRLDEKQLHCCVTSKTRSRVTKNTAKIVQSWKDGNEIGELRDQGLTRPKILILVPFRDAALKVVEVILHLICPEEGGQVMNKKRFYEQFGETEDASSSKENRPEDFKQMFAGNIDDCFRIGISVMKKCVKLYAKFYSSDIIVASPLGLRTIIGNAGEKSHEYDFLSSIEVIIADQTDVFLMQNWEHVQHIFEHLHQQPKESHDVDFSRVRMWCLNGWSSDVLLSMTNSIAFHRFDCSTFSEAADKRFQIFINKVLPDFKGSLMGHTAIFVPSYFDFVRLRNYFKREGIDCAQISEYSQPKEIQRARTYFQQGKRPFLLFTERFYFFYRYRIRGIKNIIFYELPHYSMFYAEILNFMDTRSNQSKSQMNPVTCTVLYTKSNALRLARVVGSRRCGHMISSDSHVHMLVTGDEDE
ncbi:Digestive organ expansion factor [Stylophora pistillata]|uniref:Digestive organ expansion factor n=1 Tax=Stylophora pistillata TaxID=50429 RepID=A0A2B4S6T8_STYPI|nr:Digestive organ expansion factor [Stylophora pistillata]